MKRVGWSHVTLLLCVAAYTALSLVVPAARLEVASPSARVVIEVVGVCALLFAAVVLALPGERDLPPACHTIVAALVVIGLANAAFGIGPYLWGGRVPGDHGLAFYPWVAARHVAGLLFIVAAVQRPRVGLWLTLGWSLFAFVTIELLVIAGRDLLVAPVTISDAGTSLTIVEPLAHVVLQAAPGVLFAVGSWLAARLYRTTGTLVLLWVSLALALQVYAQLHEILYPALLGPVVTSADALRLGAFVFLLVGAVVQLRHLYATRSRTVRVQASDIRHQSRLVDELGGFAEKEELFRSIVTHELATPIATIRNYSELIAAKIPRPHSAELEGALNDIRTEANGLLELVGRIDELRDLDGEEFTCELRAVRIRPLLVEAQRFVEGLGTSHAVLIDCADDRVLADPVRLGQLLRNLLMNAVRFAPAGTPIHIIGRRRQDDFEARLIDYGPGIPPEERTLVLRRSVRGRNAVGTEGLGLGLYLAEKIALGHGGSLHLAGGPEGTGTEVVVKLQVAT